ncbi:MAG: fumarylacetoacetate hydrolase family protein [Pseudomonadota bacterium]|nr:fumarylacetoacetate hydrolase family protein [Pseudomonadota bacterium]
MLNPPSKIICVGRNYAAHAKELGNAVPETPILFIKPHSSLRELANGIVWPQGQGECHFETELCVRIGQPLYQATQAQAAAAIDGVTLGLDLTLRDVQATLKANGHPWERAKAFDGACLLGDWLTADAVDFNAARFTLQINGQPRQQGDTRDMLFGVVELVAHISETFSLAEGDVIMTGTPAGVGALQQGDQLTLSLQTRTGLQHWQTHVVA